MTIEKEEKPKKLFKLEFIVWDDGEVQRDLIEYVYGDRGAPKSWRMEPQDLVKSMSAQVGGKLELFAAVMAAMDVNTTELKKVFPILDKPRIEPTKIDESRDEDLDSDEDLDFDNE